jgi:hypothetical protein
VELLTDGVHLRLEILVGECGRGRVENLLNPVVVHPGELSHLHLLHRRKAQVRGEPTDLSFGRRIRVVVFLHPFAPIRGTLQGISLLGLALRRRRVVLRLGAADGAERHYSAEREHRS